MNLNAGLVCILEHFRGGPFYLFLGKVSVAQVREQCHAATERCGDKQLLPPRSVEVFLNVITSGN